MSYHESITIYGGSEFWENFGKSLGLLYGWIQNALETGINAVGDAVSEIFNSETGRDITGVLPLTLFN